MASSRKVRKDRQEKLNFVLKKIEPLTENQKISFNAYRNGKNLMLHGIAGTGKSFISTYLALDELINKQHSTYEKLIIVKLIF